MSYFGGIPVKTIGEAFEAAPVGGGGGNPFKRDAKGSISPTAVSRAIKNNPSHARELCKAAGEPVARWFPENPR